MDLGRLRLVRPCDDLHQAYVEFAEDIARTGDDRWIKAVMASGWEAFIERRHCEAKGEGLAEGKVAQSAFWLVDDERSVHAELRLRHELTEKLLVEGGHIGYIVRPTSRRMGVGRRLLALGLLEARKLGIVRALVTCDESNVGSIGVIEANGGRDFETGVSPVSGVAIRRYWLET